MGSMGVRRSVTGFSACVVGCLTALALGGCGGGDDSVADPPVSSTTSSPTDSPQHGVNREHDGLGFFE